MTTTVRRPRPVSPAAPLMRSVLGFVGLVVVLPVLLGRLAHWRLGSATPWDGIAPPWRWRPATLRALFDDGAGSGGLVDAAVRVGLVVVWAALAVVIVHVVAEVVYVARHGHSSRGNVRGVGWAQRVARWIAAGMLAALPVATRAEARRPPVAPPVAAATEGRAVADLSDVADVHVLRFDPVAALPERPVTIAPAVGADTAPPPAVDPLPGAEHVVTDGDTLWSVAVLHLGHGARWSEIWDLNAGRPMVDGRRFEDPGLIVPGWVLQLPPAAPQTPPAAPADVATADREPIDVAPIDLRPIDPAPIDLAPIDLAPIDPAPIDTAAEVVTPAAPVPPPAPPPTVDAARPPSSVVPTPTTPVAEAARAPAAPTTAPTPGVSPREVGSDDGARVPFALGGATMLASGVVALVASRRRRTLRRTRVPAVPIRSTSAAIEQAVRCCARDDLLLRLDVAVRAAAGALAASGRRVVAAVVGDDGTVRLALDGRARPPEPWSGDDWWTLPAAVELEQLTDAARRSDAPCPLLVQLGVQDDASTVFVDLEALGLLAVDGPPDRSAPVVRALAATTASSVHAARSRLVSVALDDACFLGHRHHVACATPDDAVAFVRAVRPVPPDGRSTFASRVGSVGGETWDPVALFVGPLDGDYSVGELLDGAAVVVAGRPPSADASRLRDLGARWRLTAPGIRLELRPVMLDEVVASELCELVAAADEPRAAGAAVAGPDVEDHADGALAPGVAVAGPLVGPHGDGVGEREWQLMVRLLGPVDVVDACGRPVEFERSKALELVAWLATHRERSTRSGARAALWDVDVRDATFANVVSDARRALARRVPPPPGCEWIARTMTEDLSLAESVVTDAELVEASLRTARRGSPDEAVGILEHALGLVRGLPFEATSYAWPDGEGLTSNFVLTAIAVASELAEHHLAACDLDGVLRATSAGLRVLPGHEELVGLRLRAFGARGDRAGVRAEWQAYLRALDADRWSDGEPAAALVALREELMRSDAA